MTPAHQHFYTKSLIARGSILSLAAIMERSLDGLLSRYFSVSDQQRQLELIELLFSTERINFRSKYKLLIDILRRKLGDKYNQEFPQLQNKFDDATRVRNIFAHECEIPSDIVMPDEFYNAYHIAIVSLKDISKSRGYTENEIDVFIEQFTELSGWLDKATNVLFGEKTYRNTRVNDNRVSR